MEEKTYAGVKIQLNNEGYLIDSSQWSKEIAAEIAKEEEIELTDKHYEVLEYLRENLAKGTTITIRRVGKSGIVDIKGFYNLFSGGPLKKSSRIAGIPKPSSCV